MNNFYNYVYVVFQYKRAGETGHFEVWFRAREIWVKLYEFANSGKLVRAMLFTMQYVPNDQIRSFGEKNRKIFIEKSSVVSHPIAISWWPSGIYFDFLIIFSVAWAW